MVLRSILFSSNGYGGSWSGQDHPEPPGFPLNQLIKGALFIEVGSAQGGLPILKLIQNWLNRIKNNLSQTGFDSGTLNIPEQRLRNVQCLYFWMETEFNVHQLIIALNKFQLRGDREPARSHDYNWTLLININAHVMMTYLIHLFKWKFTLCSFLFCIYSTLSAASYPD